MVEPEPKLLITDQVTKKNSGSSGSATLVRRTFLKVDLKHNFMELIHQDDDATLGLFNNCSQILMTQTNQIELTLK